MQKILCLLSFLITSIGVYSQIPPDTTFLATSIINAEGVYNTAMVKHLNIYNGKDYKTYISKGEEHPYFLADDWMIGNIVYEESFYQEVPLMFDISSGKIITENPFNTLPMELAINKIDQFSLGKHRFVRLSKVNSTANDLEEGFYELLYDGHLKLYAKRNKDFQNRIKGNIASPEFDEKNRYFLFDGTHYSRVTSKSSILKALGSKKNLPKKKSPLQYYSTNKTENILINWINFFDQNTPAL